MKHVRDISAPRVGLYVAFTDAITLSLFTGTVLDRAGHNGGPIVVAQDGAEKEFNHKRGDRLQRIASKPWGAHAVKAVDHAQAVQAIAQAQRRAHLAIYTASIIAAASAMLVGALTISAGVIP